MGIVASIMFPGTNGDHVNHDERVPIQWVDGKYPVMLYETGKDPLVNILYFHGNAEDLCHVYHTVKSVFSDKIKINSLSSDIPPLRIIAPEYSGYGVRNEEPRATAKNCEEMADVVMMQCVLQQTPSIPTIIVGRSIGTGTAAYIAQKYQGLIYGTVLISPFSSIRNLAYHYTGNIGFTASYLLIGDTFNTIGRLKEYYNRLIIIHGTKDEVIPHSHAEEIYKNCPSTHKKLFLHKNKTHNFSEWKKLVIAPVFSTWI